MKLNKRSTSIDLTLYLSSSLLTGATLDQFQQSLVQLGPEWASQLHLERVGEPRLEIDVKRTGAIRDVVFSKGLERGDLYRRLQQLDVSRPATRRFGSIELRGASRELTIVLTFDDWVFCPIGQAWIPGNRLDVQMRSPVVEGRKASNWAEGSFAHWCSSLDPFFAFAYTIEEYYAKNMSREGGGLRAIGVDISKYLPGLYWLNFFGRPYRNLIGDERWVSAPVFRTDQCGGGYILQLSDTPEDWHLPEYETSEESVRRHLGEEYFFTRSNPGRKTVSPFDLPQLQAARSSVQADVDLDGIVREIRIKKRAD
ncbi:MAG TPA: hypothetical protein VGI16_13315 [Candidatus Acidoferrum sp.]|jgi:hypothetical protein